MAAPRGLTRLARLYGLQTTYVANDGARVSAGPESITAVLRAMGVPLESDADIPRLMEHRRRELADRTLDPVVTATAGEPGAFRLRLPPRLRAATLHVTVTLEQEEDAGLANGRPAPSAVRGSVEADRLLVQESDGTLPDVTTVEVPLPDLPPGYHELTVEAGPSRWNALLITAPERAPAWDALPGWRGGPPGGARDGAGDPRLWGVFAPLHALWERGGDQGHGQPTAPDFGLLDALAERVARHGGAVVGTLPLLAAFLDEPYEPSPYAPVSRLFWNEMYTDPTRAPGWDDLAGGATAPGRATAWEETAEDGVRYLDHRAVMALKRPALKALARRFFAEGDPPELLSYRARNPQADDYARFRALTARHGPWPQWPDRLRARDIRTGDYDEDVCRYHIYVQWLAERQLGEVTERAAGRGVALYLDLPMGVHGSGYDVWRHRQLFARNAGAGAPPDHLAPEGQDWGFPPLRPEASRLDRHRYFIASIRNHLRFARVLRVDHVMQLHRMYWVPGGEPTRGVYVRYPFEELYGILRLEAHRAGAVIVGEDLGTVPRAVRRGMRRNGLRGMYVAQFEAAGAKGRLRLPRVTAGAVASIGTHDTAMFASWWERWEGRVPRREKPLEGEPLTATDPHQALADIHQRLGRSRAGLVLATMEDLWLEPRPQNVPGTTAATNWRRRSAEPLESLMSGRPAELLRALNTAREGMAELSAGEEPASHRSARRES